MLLGLNENYNFRKCCLLAWFGNVAEEGRGEGREGEGSGQVPRGQLGGPAGHHPAWGWGQPPGVRGHQGRVQELRERTGVEQDHHIVQ